MRLAGLSFDFVVRDVCCIWNTQDMTEAPLVKISVIEICHFPILSAIAYTG